MKQEWTTRDERSNIPTIRFIVWVALTFGRRFARSLLYPICLYFVIFSGESRIASRQYLDLIFARKTGMRETFHHYFAFASTILDRVFLLNNRSSEFDISVHGLDIVEKNTAQGRGCFFVGAHMGSFEVLHALSRKHNALYTHMMMYEENARKLNGVLKQINPELNPPVIALGRVDSMLKLEQALQRGESVGLLVDRTISGEKTFACDFFGKPMHFPLGPFRLAAIIDRPIILMFGLYMGGNRYVVHFEELGVKQTELKSRRHAAVEESIKQYAARLEHYCRIAPYNWYNFYDVWKK